MEVSVNMLLICIFFYCDAGPGCLIRTVCKNSIVILITENIFVLVRFLLRRRSYTSRKIYDKEVFTCLAAI